MQGHKTRSGIRGQCAGLHVLLRPHVIGHWSCQEIDHSGGFIWTWKIWGKKLCWSITCRVLGTMLGVLYISILSDTNQHMNLTGTVVQICGWANWDPYLDLTYSFWFQICVLIMLRWSWMFDSCFYFIQILKANGASSPAALCKAHDPPIPPIIL